MAHFLWLLFLAAALAGNTGVFVYQLVCLWQERRRERIRRAERPKQTPIIRTGRR